MRTNIVIDEDLMAQAMKAGPYKTKKEAVEAGLRLLARQAAYREVLKWRGRLQWEGDENVDWTVPSTEAAPALEAREPAPGRYRAKAPAKRAAGKRRAGR